MKRLIAMTIGAAIICSSFGRMANGQDETGSFMNSLRKNTWEIGPEIYHFKYKEPDVMKETGMFYGIFGAYTYRGWAQASPEEHPGSKWMFRYEGRFAAGLVDYDGATFDETPLTISNIDDRTFEGRILLGPDFPKANSIDTLYFGLGYRFLKDDVGYKRESNYFYIPLGIDSMRGLKNGWYFGWTAEYDLFIRGQQNSHLSDVGYVDIENKQDSGHGLRGSVKFVKKEKKTDFIIEPFIRYWDIDNSDIVDVGFYEPANKTWEYGIRFTWCY